MMTVFTDIQAKNPWITLGRWDRPVGIVLVLIPALAGLLISGGLTGLTLLVFSMGAAFMRASGCIFNDWIDRDIDAQVTRTRNRPLAAQLIQNKSVLYHLSLLLAGAFFCWLFLNPPTKIIALLGLPLVLLYPFTKRFFFAPQLFMGVTFTWGFWMGIAQGHPPITLDTCLFYLGLVLWATLYDTVYGLMDSEEDKVLKLYSLSHQCTLHKTLLYSFWAIAFLSFWISAGDFLMRCVVLLIAIGVAHDLWKLDLSGPPQQKLAFFQQSALWQTLLIGGLALG